MVIKNIQVPKSQHPNFIKKDYRDKYLISLQTKTLRYFKDGFNNVDMPQSEFIAGCAYLTDCQYLFSMLNQDLLFRERDAKTSKYIVSYSSKRSAIKYLSSQALVEQKWLSFCTCKIHLFHLFDQLMVAYEAIDSLGCPNINYKLYQIEILPKGNFENDTISYCNYNFFNRLPSQINDMMEWKPTLI